jgi:hypothetical protein
MSSPDKAARTAIATKPAGIVLKTGGNDGINLAALATMFG